MRVEWPATRMTFGLWKPWFLYRPGQIVRRVIAEFRAPAKGFAPLATSWGGRVIADPTRAIGRSIVVTGVFDLAVSEILARLIAPGDTVIDAGANVGYMTVLAAAAAGRRGHVIAFEPHPDLFQVLLQNVEFAGRFGCRVEPHQVALGDANGTSALNIPDDFDGNDGMATLAPMPSRIGSVVVNVRRLDDLVDGSVAVMKVDVEGFEARLLRGAERLLAARKVRHIVFEDHEPGQSEMVRMLAHAGYRLFAIGWRTGGLAIAPIERRPLSRMYEAPSFVATLAEADLMACTRRRGWQVLSPRFSRAR